MKTPLWVALALIVGAAGCDDDKLRHTVAVAVELPLTWPFGDDPLSIGQAAQLAVEDRKSVVCETWDVTLIFHDQSTPDEPVSDTQVDRNTKMAVRNADVAAMLGPYTSGIAMRMLPTTNRAHMLMVSPSNTSSCLTMALPECEGLDLAPSGVPSYARFAPPDSKQGLAQAKLAASLSKLQLHIVYREDEYGQIIRSAIRDAAPGLGQTIVGDSPYNADELDPEAIAADVVASGADVVFVAAFDEAADLIIAMHEAGYSGQIIVGDGAFGDGLLENLGAEAEGIYATLPGLAVESLPAAGVAWATRFEARFGHEPYLYSLESYLSMNLILDSLEEACLTSLPTDRESVRRAALATKERQGLLGAYHLDARGDVSLGNIGVYKVTGGEYVYSTSL